jgi:hypothetical protein
MGLLFFPRGGSAQVTRSLAHVLPQQGWDITVVSSSLQVPGLPGDAHTFFEGLDLYPLDCTAALDAADPLLADPPLPPSYEDRPGAPDRVFAQVDDATYAHLADVWARALSGGRRGRGHDLAPPSLDPAERCGGACRSPCARDWASAWDGTAHA